MHVITYLLLTAGNTTHAAVETRGREAYRPPFTSCTSPSSPIPGCLLTCSPGQAWAPGTSSRRVYSFARSPGWSRPGRETIRQRCFGIDSACRPQLTDAISSWLGWQGWSGLRSFSPMERQAADEST